VSDRHHVAFFLRKYKYNAKEGFKVTTGINWLEGITAFLTVNFNLALWAVFILTVIRKKTRNRRSHEKYLIDRLVKKCGNHNPKPSMPPPPYYSQQLCLFKQIQKSKLKGEIDHVSNIFSRV